MAPHQAERNVGNVELQRLSLGDQVKGERLKETQRRQERTASNEINIQTKQLSRSPTIDAPSIEFQQAGNRKQNRSQKAQSPSSTVKPFPERSQTSPRQLAIEGTPSETTTSGVDVKEINPIEFWTRKQRWPKALFQQDDHTREDLEQEDSWYEKYWVLEMNPLLARKRLSRSSLTTITATPSDQLPREVKSAPYRDESYETFLASRGSFMGKSELGIADASRSLCRTLLEEEQPVPQESLFCDDIIEKACKNLQNRNEPKVIQHIAQLIVPSAEILAMLGLRHLQILVESFNQGWNNSIPISRTRPQPDYAVGFSREAFTEDQLKRLHPFVGELTDTSYFMATYFMYFPFLTCEVKCGAAALGIADRQNAHSMTMAVRGIVELFRLVKREKELHREILAFSVSHDNQRVRIYGHYPIIDGNKTTFYRHPIHDLNLTMLDGKEKWTTYKFTRNLYDLWMPSHFKRICSVIDEFPPDIAFEVPQQSDFEVSQRSNQRASKRSQDAASLQEEAKSQSRTSLSQGIGRASKRAKREELH
ncbi:hypothetical protein V502_04392 [Pseudogymnoascus sp. VKM F-4520 (FW-2644)]|nr:hypothetical protein V502_04392 [Pseudogymnoascus sp. VKM F-4520 (FW-2644)]